VLDWDGPAVLLPRQQAKLARGAKDEEHAMSQRPNTTIAVIGIDIGKNRSTSSATMRAAAAKVVAWPSGDAARQSQRWSQPQAKRNGRP